MRTIRISAEVWDAIAAHGKFGETPDDVLRRVFSLRPARDQGDATRRRQATRTMTARIEDGHLLVAFVGGPSRKFALPPRSDRPAVRKVRNAAVTFAHDNGATVGQENAVKKALTEAGYHIAR